uniref:Uncharacterized protein n=1 Tax=Oryza brachyantha TaxID=4533 RepID=J3MRD3_ORYBR
MIAHREAAWRRGEAQARSRRPAKYPAKAGIFLPDARWVLELYLAMLVKNMTSISWLHSQGIAEFVGSKRCSIPSANHCICIAFMSRADLSNLRSVLSGPLNKHGENLERRHSSILSKPIYEFIWCCYTKSIRHALLILAYR